MPLGYLGYLRLETQYLLATSTGLNRQVSPLLSTGVWGAGWYNAARTTNYADNQMHYEGAMNFELQAEAAIWNRFRDWLIEERAYSKDVTLSPQGTVVYDYTVDPADPRTGVWLSQAGFTVDNNALVTISATGIALKRTETLSETQWGAGLKTNVGIPTKPLNPTPTNRNPIPGWNCFADINLSPAVTFPDNWEDPANLSGFVLMNANFTVNNNTQVIRGCTADPNPVAVLQGTIGVDGTMNLWRDGPLNDPYETLGNLSAVDSSITLTLGGAGGLSFSINHILLSSDAYDISGQDSPVTRNFGFAGLGDGVSPPFLMDSA